MGKNRKSVEFTQGLSVIEGLTTTKGLAFRNTLDSQVLSELVRTYFPNYRERVFSPIVTLFAFLNQVLSTDGSCSEAVARVNAERLSQGLPTVSSDTGAYCRARERLPDAMIQKLVKHAASVLQDQVPKKWLWKGRNVKIVDGSTLTTADSSSNRAAYPRHKNKKGYVGFPMSRMVVLFSLATGCIVDFANGAGAGKGTGEHSLFRSLLGALQNGDIVLGDGYYSSYFLIWALKKIGVDCVFRSMRTRNGGNFKRGKKLGKKDHIISWKKPHHCPSWMDKQVYSFFEKTLEIRECELKVIRKGFRPKEIIIVTTLMNSKEITKNDLCDLFSQRWQAELNLRSLKCILNLDFLRGKTPKMIQKEIWIRLLSYNLIRHLMGEAARSNDCIPSKISFKKTVQTLNMFRSVLLAKNSNRIFIMEQLLISVGKNRVGNRPDRIEPRAIKRGAKTYPKLRVSRD
jgi:hypothetical protein